MDKWKAISFRTTDKDQREQEETHSIGVEERRAEALLRRLRLLHRASARRNEVTLKKVLDVETKIKNNVIGRLTLHRV